MNGGSSADTTKNKWLGRTEMNEVGDSGETQRGRSGWEVLMLKEDLSEKKNYY